MTYNQSYLSNHFHPDMTADTGTVKIVQMSDDQKTLPDGSKIIYAESESKIILYHKRRMEEPTTYVFERKTGKIFVKDENGTVPGDNSEKKAMISLGHYLMSNCKESEMVTISVQNKTSQ